MTSEAGGREERDRWGEGENETNHQRKIGDAKAASSTVTVPVTAPHSRPPAGRGGGAGAGLGGRRGNEGTVTSHLLPMRLAAGVQRTDSLRHATY